jgi:hypothetical protein
MIILQQQHTAAAPRRFFWGFVVMLMRYALHTQKNAFMRLRAGEQELNAYLSARLVPVPWHIKLRTRLVNLLPNLLFSRFDATKMHQNETI